MRFIFLLSFVLATPALAQNWVGILKNTPAERFNEEDLRIFMDVATKALDGAQENQPLKWENPNTKHGGEITLLRSFESKGRPCKEMRVRNQADGRKGDTRLSLCKVDGKWRLLSAAQKK